MDLILSSGFLAFGAQCGFLSGVEDAGVAVDGVVGTSSGALAGALYCCGWTSERIHAELCARRPLSFMRPSAAPWRGLLSLEPAVQRMRALLPARFEDLERPFAVGVVHGGEHVLLRSGPLPEAVAASCAIPYVFRPVVVQGRAMSDGGAADRTGVEAWRSWRPGRTALLHLVDRSSGPAHDERSLDGLAVVRSPRSGASFLSLGDVDAQRETSRASAAAVIASLS